MTGSPGDMEHRIHFWAASIKSVYWNLSTYNHLSKSIDSRVRKGLFSPILADTTPIRVRESCTLCSRRIAAYAVKGMGIWFTDGVAFNGHTYLQQLQSPKLKDFKIKHFTVYYIACLLVKSTTREGVLVKFGSVKNACGISSPFFLLPLVLFSVFPEDALPVCRDLLPGNP